VITKAPAEPPDKKESATMPCCFRLGMLLRLANLNLYAPGTIRTFDPQLRRLLLYGFFKMAHPNKKQELFFFCLKL
jgi:hypothetical protein